MKRATRTKNFLDNKKGVEILGIDIAAQKILFLIITALIFLLLVSYLPLEQDIPSLKKFDSKIKIIGKYIFGVDETKLAQASGDKALNTEAIVITALMLWLIIFVAFGDVFANFSALSPIVSWLIAFGFAVIAAVSGGISAGVLSITKIFAKSAFGVFITFGIIAAVLIILGSVSPSIKRWNKLRKAKVYAMKKALKEESAGKIIKNLESINEELGK